MKRAAFSNIAIKTCKIVLTLKKKNVQPNCTEQFICNKQRMHGEDEAKKKISILLVQHVPSDCQFCYSINSPASEQKRFNYL